MKYSLFKNHQIKIAYQAFFAIVGITLSINCTLTLPFCHFNLLMLGIVLKTTLYFLLFSLFTIQLLKVIVIHVQEYFTPMYIFVILFFTKLIEKILASELLNIYRFLSMSSHDFETLIFGLTIFNTLCFGFLIYITPFAYSPSKK